MQDLPSHMRGVYLMGHGGFEQLQYRDDIPLPEFGARDVLVKVSAAAVNNTDLNTRKAWYSKQENASDDAAWTGQPLQFPLIQGIDVCGTVVKVGADADQQLLNRRVLIEPCLHEADGVVRNPPWFLGSECNGGFAEYTTVAARHVYPIDSDLTDIELASFPCSYSTAENLLTRATVTSGDCVLITGASGGVGSAAVQLAKARGATVIAVTSASKSHDLLALGADRSVDRRQNLLAQLGRNHVDVVIDVVAGAQFPDLLEVLKPFGRYAVSGAIGGPLVNLDVRTLYLKDLKLMGATVLDQGVFAQLIKRIEAGEIQPLLAKTFALKDIVAAQQYFESKDFIGKIVLRVADSSV